MKNHRNKIVVCSMILLFSLASCYPYSNIFKEDSSLLSVSVSDSGFAPAPATQTTRATDNDYTTTFAKGDQIGLYVVDSSNTVETANLCLTYDGTSWNYPTGTMIYYNSTSKYFAYYPYQSTISGAPTTSATTATSFFSTLISNWQPSTDQSSQAKYTASDLMVGTGIVGTLASNATRPMTFNMTHQMALIDLNIPYYYLSTDNNYTYTLGLTYVGFNPFHLSKGKYRYIIKPATSTSIWGSYCPTTSSTASNAFNKAFSVAQGTYQTMNVDGGAIGTSHTLAIGDYYLNDGGIIPNATANKYLLNNAIGVIFSTSTSATDKGHGWTHGYAMALTNAATSVTWGALIDTSLANIQTNTSWTILSNNKEGYTETQTIKSTYNLSDYPAFNAVLNYSVTAPKNSSKWFLPSCGQWYDIFVNLGGMPATPTGWGNYNLISTSWVRWSPGDGGSNDYGATAATNINNYLYTLINYGYTVDKIINNSQNSLDKTVSYWCSSEIDSNQGFDAHLYNESGVGDGNGMETKSVAHPVRPVIAF